MSAVVIVNRRGPETVLLRHRERRNSPRPRKIDDDDFGVTADSAALALPVSFLTCHTSPQRKNSAKPLRFPFAIGRQLTSRIRRGSVMGASAAVISDLPLAFDVLLCWLIWFWVVSAARLQPGRRCRLPGGPVRAPVMPHRLLRSRHTVSVVWISRRSSRRPTSRPGEARFRAGNRCADATRL